MGKKKKQKIRQLTAEEASFGPVDDPREAEELMHAFFAAETGDLLKKKGIIADEGGNKDRTPRSAKQRGARGRLSIEIDLHGFTLAEAICQVDLQISHSLASGCSSLAVTVITGKGIHSGKEGGVLHREVYRHFIEKYKRNIIFIDSPPASALLNGVPFRGHFSVLLKGT